MSARAIVFTLSVGVLVSASACVSPPLPPEGTNAALARRLLEGLSSGDFGVFDELCTPGYRFHAAGEAEPMGCAAQKRSVRELRAAFSGLEHRIDDVFAAGDRVAFRLTHSGTHSGDYLGIPATGNRVRFRSIGVARFANGTLVEMWMDVDWPTLFDQIGTTPPAWHRRWADRLFEPAPPLVTEPPGAP